MLKYLSLGAFVGLLVWVAAQASTPLTYTVTWSAPRTYTDNTTIVGAITYQLYVGPSGQEVKYKTPVTSPPYILVPLPDPGITCVQVTATVNKVESAPSAEVCASVPTPPPPVVQTPQSPGNVAAVVK